MKKNVLDYCKHCKLNCRIVGRVKMSNVLSCVASLPRKVSHDIHFSTYRISYNFCASDKWTVLYQKVAHKQTLLKYFNTELLLVENGMISVDCVTEEMFFTFVSTDTAYHGWTEEVFSNGHVGGSDLFTMIASDRLQFFHATGETPETFLHLIIFVDIPVYREHSFSVPNGVLLFLMWIRNYPIYNILANIFNVSLLCLMK